MAIPIIKGILIERSSPLTLEELAQALHLQNTLIMEMIEYRLIQPEGNSPDTWQFDDTCFKRAKLAASFYRDLEINIQGIALALDLLEKIDHLEQKLEILQRLTTEEKS